MANYSKYLDSSFKIQGSEKTCSIQPLWIQDSNLRLRKNFFNPTCLDSRFKIQGSEKTSSIQPLWIQDSRLQKKVFTPTGLDSRFKIQGWRPSGSRSFLGSWILNPTPLDSRSLFGISNLESYPLGFKKVFLGSWIWNLESYPLGFKKSFGILNLESWIRCT